LSADVVPRVTIVSASGPPFTKAVTRARHASYACVASSPSVCRPRWTLAFERS